MLETSQSKSAGKAVESSLQPTLQPCCLYLRLRQLPALPTCPTQSNCSLTWSLHQLHLKAKSLMMAMNQPVGFIIIIDLSAAVCSMSNPNKSMSYGEGRAASGISRKALSPIQSHTGTLVAERGMGWGHGHSAHSATSSPLHSQGRSLHGETDTESP